MSFKGVITPVLIQMDHFDSHAENRGIVTDVEECSIEPFFLTWDESIAGDRLEKAFGKSR